MKNLKLPWLVLLVLLSVLGATIVVAESLTDPATGLTLEAPAGYTLTSVDGIYTLKKGKLSARFMRARSPLTLDATVDSLIKLSGLKVSKRKKKNGKVQVDGTIKQKGVTVLFSPVGEAIDVATVSGKVSAGKPKKKKKKKAGRALRDLAALTANELQTLLQIINGRQGGISVPLQLAVPMRKFTAPDGKSTAQVPDLPGWNFIGGDGIVAGGNINQGIFELGVPTLVSYPGYPSSVPPVSLPVTPDVAIATVWPQYANVQSGAQIQVLNVQLVPGTDGFLGPNQLSGMYAIRFTLGGKTWQGLMTSGVFDVGLFNAWGWYHSYISVPEDGPGGVGAALVNTWATWNNSVASDQRISQAINTLLSIQTPGGAIDPDVFQEASNAWSEYLRE